MSDLDKLQRGVGEWGKRTFPQSHAGSIVKHLTEEVAELRAAVERMPLATDAHAEEAADCLLLLLHLAHRSGFSLFDAAVVKFSINRQRTWETDGGDKGYCKHVEAETA